MKSRRIFWIALIAIMAMVLVACDSGGDDDGDDDDGGGDAQGVELSQSVSLEDVNVGGTLTVSYPEDWAATEAAGGRIALANGEDTLELVGGDAVPSGDQVGGFMVMLPSALLEASGLSADSPIADVLAAFANEEGSETFEDITTTDVNGVSVASAIATNTLGEATVDNMVAVVVLDEGIVLANFFSGEGEMSDFEGTIQAIMSSATFEASE